MDHMKNMNVSVQGNELVLSFPYDEAMVTKVRNIPGSRFHKASKTWRFLLTPHTYENVKSALNVICPEIEVVLKTMSVYNIDQHNFKTKPYDHQMEGLLLILTKFYGVEVTHGKGSGGQKNTIRERNARPSPDNKAQRTSVKQHTGQQREPIDI